MEIKNINTKDDLIKYLFERGILIESSLLKNVTENESSFKKLKKFIKSKKDNFIITEKDFERFETKNNKTDLEEIAKEILYNSITEGLNYRDSRESPNPDLQDYDGFDMSGFRYSFYKNMEILARFKHYMAPLDEGIEYPRGRNIVPIFWKGKGDICHINSGNIIESCSGKDTRYIIFRIIQLQYKEIFNEMAHQLKKEFEFLKDDYSLANLKDENIEYTKTTTINKFKRNISLVKKLKQKYKNCQVCGHTFVKKNGEPYLEAHHVIPLSQKGKDKEINTLILCANCHKKLHFADVDLSRFHLNKIKINQKTHIIKR